MYKSITPEFLNNMIKNDKVKIIDCRGRHSFHLGHIENADNIPDVEFIDHLDMLPQDREKPIIFYCKDKNCILSPNSASKADSLGYKNVYVLDGGIEAWSKYYTTVADKEAEDSGSLSSEKFKELYKSKKESIQLVDVNDKEDYDRGHIKGAINIPIGIILGDYNKLPNKKIIVFYCKSGVKSEEIYYFLKDNKIVKDNIYYINAAVSFCEGRVIFNNN